jgi:regulator of chromosome condensation
LLTPAAVHFKRRKTEFSDVWAGQYVTYALAKQSGEVYAWGLNNYHQLGFNDMKNRYVPEKVKSFNSDKGWVDIAGGQHHAIALDKDGQVYSVGRKEYGRLGHGEDNLQDMSAPTLITALSGIKCISVSCGTATSFAVTEDVKFYSWGMGTSRQLAQTEEDDLFIPTQMMGKQLETRSGLDITAGGQHTVILAKDV